MSCTKTKKIQLVEELKDVYANVEIECPENFQNKDILDAYYGGKNNDLIKVINWEEDYHVMERNPVSITEIKDEQLSSGSRK